MTDGRDPLLETLFAEATQPDLDGDTFAAEVLSKSRFLKVRSYAPWVVLGLVLVVGVWVLAIPLEFAQLIAQYLSYTLVDLGEGWLAWVLSPVNNVAALLALGVKALRMGRNKIIAASRR